MGIDASDISHRYGQQDALLDVSVSLSTSVTALVGVNGAGKSTLLNILAGALRPTHGDVTVNGASLYGKSRGRLMPQVALMPQSFDYPRSFTALEFVEYLGWMRGLDRRRCRNAALAAIASVNLSDRAHTPMKELSGGMIRRVGLAQALVAKPEILLLDEPTTGLDPEQRATMRQLIAELPATTTVFLSSHVMEDVEQIAQRLIIVDECRIVFDDTVAALQHQALPPDRGSLAEAGFLNLVAARRQEAS
jgi:ABC-2 type transport system ATP-binding protein